MNIIPSKAKRLDIWITMQFPDQFCDCDQFTESLHLPRSSSVKWDNIGTWSQDQVEDVCKVTSKLRPAAKSVCMVALLMSSPMEQGASTTFCMTGLARPGPPLWSYPSHLRGQCVVVRGLTGQQDMREPLFLPDDNVPKPTVAFILADAVPEPLVKDIVLLCFQLPLHRVVQV